MSVAYPVAREAGVVVRELDGEMLVYDLDSHEAHCLNKTAAAVWRRCDGDTTVARIAAELGYEEEVVWLALEQLWKLDLLAGERFGASTRGRARTPAIGARGSSLPTRPPAHAAATPRRRFRFAVRAAPQRPPARVHLALLTTNIVRSRLRDHSRRAQVAAPTLC